MNPDSPTRLSPGQPLNQPEADRLNYTNFAKSLASSILTMTPPEGLVIAIYGDWGLGKTTVLNFIEYYLNQDKKPPIIIRFNPWWFSGADDLVFHFFQELGSDSKLKKFLDKTSTLLRGLGRIISKVPGGEIAGETLATLLPKEDERNLGEVKNQIAEQLRNQTERIIVVIDDLDRLLADEIRQMFRVIKAVADFPNVIYLLAFDKEVVIKALEQTQGVSSGEAYLEKIVQVPFELPLPEGVMLAEFLKDKLSGTVGQLPKEFIPDDFFLSLRRLEVMDHIAQIIKTPRDVIRLSNTLSVTYPAVKSEVYLYDFIIIEIFRVFAPDIYQFIRTRKNELTLFPMTDQTLTGLKKLVSSHSEAADSIVALLESIFPNLKGNNPGYLDSESYLRANLRISSYDIFDTYFRFTVPVFSITQRELLTFKELTSDAERLSAYLLDLAKQLILPRGNRALLLLERVLDRSSHYILDENISQVITSLFNVGDILLMVETQAFSPSKSEEINKVLRVIRQLAEKIDNANRYDLFAKALDSADAKVLTFYMMYVLRRQQGKYDTNDRERHPLLTGQEVDDLEKIVTKKIQEFLSLPDALKQSYLPLALSLWHDINEVEVRNWVTSATHNDDELLTFVDRFVEQCGIKKYCIKPDLSNYLDIDLTRERVARLLTASVLEGNRLEIAQKFLEAIRGSDSEEDIF